MSPILRRAAALVVLMLPLCACGSYPLPTLYVLSDRTPATPGVVSRVGAAVIELKSVSVPEDLDSTDIVRREGANRAIASPTGQWKDRLSVSVTSALAADLRRRLPGLIVETDLVSPPDRRIFVQVERFEIATDGVCTLTARWRLSDARGKIAVQSEEGTFVQIPGHTGDAAAAAAMTQAIDDLAKHVAVTIRSGSPST